MKQDEGSRIEFGRTFLEMKLLRPDVKATNQESNSLKKSKNAQVETQDLGIQETGG